MFHGTREVNIDKYGKPPTSASAESSQMAARSILKVGLHVGGTHGVPVTNGAAYGPGIYLGTHANVAMGYAQGGNRIIACRGKFRRLSHCDRE